MKNTKIIVTIFCLIVLVAGILNIYFFADPAQRTALVLILGAITIIIQRVVLMVIKNRSK